MKKLIFTIATLTLFFSKSGFSQTSYGEAIQQLQNYADQVNRIYLAEYWNTIPNQRCPAYDSWRRPYNPSSVQYCRLQTLGYLNQWYGQQCNYVNYWYAQIANAGNKGSGTKPAPTNTTGTSEKEEIDTNKIETLAAGVDEDQMVKITIPNSPEGFKHK